MKMTPEQKTFFEYGAAWETVCILHGYIRMYIKEMDKINPPLKMLHRYRNVKTNLRKAIRDAWQKRAACRAWMPKDKRHCANCKYTDCLEWDMPCCECSRCSSFKNVDQWEPQN